MIQNRRERIDFDREPEVESPEQVLEEIAADARKLKNRYLKDTVVPEGGE
jgi:hypothetical protein